MNPLVSIIVPIYNVENYLSQCIDSLLAQSYRNIEIILVDDGSNDSSGSIADEFAKKDHRIRVIHTSNNGVSSARNKGIETSTGEYICFVDADDSVLPIYVEYLLNLILTYDADISLTTTMYMSSIDDKKEKDHIIVLSPEEATEAILYYYIPIGCYCKMFKKSLLQEYSIRFIPEIFMGEGFNFNTAALQRARKVVRGQKKIYVYRMDNPTSAMTKFNEKKIICGIEALQRIHQDLHINTNRIYKAWKYANWHTYCDMYYFFKQSNAKKLSPLLYKKVVSTVRCQAYLALNAPIPIREKIKSIILCIFPAIIPYLKKKRAVRVIGQ